MAKTGEPLSDARRAPALTAEELEAFRQTADDARRANTFWSGQYAWTVARLLAEVERLRELYDALLSLSNAALDNSKRHEAEMHAALMRILDDADTFGWTSDAVSAARRTASPL